MTHIAIGRPLLPALLVLFACGFSSKPMDLPDRAIAHSEVAGGPSPEEFLQTNIDRDLVRAAKEGRNADLAALLHAGADPNASSDGMTALMWSAMHGHVEGVKVLLEAGATADQRDEYGGTALLIAAANGQSEAVRELVAGGSDVNAHTHDGETPLIVAAQGGYLASAKLLLDAGADKDGRDRQGYTSLIWAARDGYVDLVKHLLRVGADPTAVASDGTTALSAAAQRNHKAVVVLLRMAVLKR